MGDKMNDEIDKLIESIYDLQELAAAEFDQLDESLEQLLEEHNHVLLR